MPSSSIDIHDLFYKSDEQLLETYWDDENPLVRLLTRRLLDKYLENARIRERQQEIKKEIVDDIEKILENIVKLNQEIETL